MTADSACVLLKELVIRRHACAILYGHSGGASYIEVPINSLSTDEQNEIIEDAEARGHLAVIALKRKLIVIS